MCYNYDDVSISNYICPLLYTLFQNGSNTTFISVYVIFVSCSHNKV